MKYILIYERLSGYDDSCSTYWADDFDPFETYDELVEFMANSDLKYPDQYKWHYIFKTDQSLLTLYIDDVNKRYMELLKEKQEKIEAKKIRDAELAREREEKFAVIQEQREKALLKELLEKYGKKE